MANEDDKGYSVSDEKSFDLDRTDAHGLTLNSSNPVVTNIKQLGITSELPKLTDEKSQKPLKAEDLGKKKRVITAKVASSEDASKPTDSDLSSFTQWLKSLKKPSIDNPELIDPRPVDPLPAKDGAPIEASNSTEQEVFTETLPVETVAAQEQNEIQDGSKDKKPKKKKKKKKKQKQQADDGDPIILSDEVYSETLAELLESQGHTTEAIAMYEKLRLKYPEKSRFFAAKIEKLHKKA